MPELTERETWADRAPTEEELNHAGYAVRADDVEYYEGYESWDYEPEDEPFKGAAGSVHAKRPVVPCYGCKKHFGFKTSLAYLSGPGSKTFGEGNKDAAITASNVIV